MAALHDERLEQEEPLVVWQWRYDQARELGLTILEAGAFADSPADLGRLRELVERGCAPELALRIV